MTGNRSDIKKEEADNLAVGAKGSAIAFALKMVATVFGFSNQVLLARILGAGGIGEVILAVTVVRISVQIAKFGMEETMMKFIPLYVDQDDASRLKGTISFAIKYCLLFSTVFMLFVLAGSKFISINIFHSEGLLKLMPIVVVAIPAWVIRDIIGGIIKGYKDALSALVSESFISPFFRIVIFLILIIDGVSPLYAAVAFVAAEIIAVAVSIIILREKTKRLKPIKGKCEKKEILNIAYTIIFTGMSVLLYTQADIWILGMFTSTEMVGIYGVAAKVALLVNFPVMALAAVVPSIISSVYASGEITELRKVTRESTRWILSMAMPIVLILMLEGNNILRYAYGPEFAAGYMVLIILTLGQLIKAGSGLIGILLQMTGGHKVYMKVNIFWGIMNVVLNVILVPRYGLLGAATATAFCLSMVDIICIFIIYKRLSIFTLARGVLFDLFFIIAVTIIYFIFDYSNYYLGRHLLLTGALMVYLWKSAVKHDIPWRLLVPK